MKKFLIILLFLSANFFNVFAIEADVFVQSTLNRASQILAKNINLYLDDQVLATTTTNRQVKDERITQ